MGFGWVWVGMGGALGALTRYGIATWVETWWQGSFAVGTLIANVVGCFLIGILTGSGSTDRSEPLRLGLGVGFLGGLTTFSTFGADTYQHFSSEGELAHGIANIGLNVSLGLIAVMAGYFIGRRWFSVGH